MSVPTKDLFKSRARKHTHTLLRVQSKRKTPPPHMANGEFIADVEAKQERHKSRARVVGGMLGKDS